MRLNGFQSGLVDWEGLTPWMDEGEQGYMLSRTAEAGDVRIRKVDCSPDFRSSHWCEHGHVILVLDGELDLEFQFESQQSQTHRLVAGMSFHIPEGERPHRVHSKEGAVLFILD